MPCDSTGPQDGRDSFLLWSPTVGLGCWRINCRHCIRRIPATHRPRSYHPAKHFAGTIMSTTWESLEVLCTVNHSSQRIWGIESAGNPSCSRVQVGYAIEVRQHGQYAGSSLICIERYQWDKTCLSSRKISTLENTVHWQPLLCAG